MWYFINIKKSMLLIYSLVIFCIFILLWTFIILILFLTFYQENGKHFPVTGKLSTGSLEVGIQVLIKQEKTWALYPVFFPWGRFRMRILDLSTGHWMYCRHQIFWNIYLSVLVKILSVPKFTANLYCICLSRPQIYT